MSQSSQPISYQRSGSLHEENEMDEQHNEESRPVLSPPTTSSSSSPRRKSSIVQVVNRAFSIGDESIQELPDWESERQAICMRKYTTAFLLICSLALPIAIWGRVVQSRNYHIESDTMTENDNNVCVEDPFASLAPDSVLTNLANGAVATDHPLCSQMGLNILQDGGNAIDAAITVALCLGVSNPASSGLGGGAFMLIHADPPKEDKDSLPDFIDARNVDEAQSTQYASGKISEVIDCRETAPGVARKDMFEDKPDWTSAVGPLSIAVPGELRGLELAHARHGSLPWAHVVKPVVELARNGVPVNPNLAREIAFIATLYKENKIPEANPYMRSILTKTSDWDHPLEEGDLLFNHELTLTLQMVLEEGADALYTGPVAEKLASDVQKVGGILTKQDLIKYRAVLRSPVVGRNIAGTGMVGVPPPSSGGATVIGAARFLAGFHGCPLATFADTLTVHRKVEACKHAFAIRMSLSDPDFNTDTVAEAVKDLVETDYMDNLRLSHLDNATLPMSMYGGEKWAQLKDTDGAKNASDAQEGDRRNRRLRGRPFGYLNDNGTSHFSIVDKDGNAVSMTTSVNAYFGSNIYSPSTGVLLGDTMDDFANPGRANFFGLRPSEANYIAPGKRPLSSMAPTMVFRESTTDGSALGDLMLCTGASGGPKIISAVTSIFANVIMLGMPLFEAVLSPRVHDQLIYHGSASTTVENDPLEGGPRIILSNRTRLALQTRGHRLIDVDYEGTVQAISIDLETKLMTAVCDVRKGGNPAGY